METGWNEGLHEPVLSGFRPVSTCHYTIHTIHKLKIDTDIQGMYMDGLVLWFGYGSEICHSISVSSISVWDKQNDWISATHSYTVYSLQHVLFASLKKQLALTKHINVKQSHYRPGQALRFHEFEAPRFQHIRLMKVVRLSAICTGHFYLQKTFLVLISVRG